MVWQHKLGYVRYDLGNMYDYWAWNYLVSYLVALLLTSEHSVAGLSSSDFQTPYLVCSNFNSHHSQSDNEKKPYYSR